MIMILKNYIYNAIFQVLRIILPFITMPYVARVLSPEGVGAYSVSAAWANYFMILGMIGIDTYGSRQIAYVRENVVEKKKEFWEINTLKSISTLFFIFLYTILIFGIIKPDNYVLYLIQLLNLFSCFFDVSWYFTGMENFKSTSMRNVVVKVISTIAIFVLVKKQDDVWLYTLILCLGQLLGQLVMWKEIYKELFPIELPKVYALLPHFKKTLLLWVPSLAASIYNYLDKVMLGTFSNEFQVGLYEYSQNIVKVPAVLIFTIATVTMPHTASDFAKKNDAKMSNIFNTSMGVVSMLSIPMCIGFIAISDNFISWFLGSQYGEVAALIKISAWIIIPISWSQIIGSQLIIAKSREKMYSISICSGAVVNVLLNLLLVQKFEARGVLVASVIAEIVVLAAMIRQVREEICFKKAFEGVFKYLLVSIIMFIPTRLLQNCDVILEAGITVLQIFVGIVIYFTLLLLLKDKNIMLLISKVKEKVKK